MRSRFRSRHTAARRSCWSPARSSRVTRSALLLAGLLAGCRFNFDASAADAAGGAGDDALRDGATGPIAFIESTFSNCGGVTSCVAQASGLVQPGNLLIVAATYDNLTVSVTGISDPDG